MFTASKIVRTIALAMMSAGGAAIVFAAVVLVKAAQANGIPTSEAATANAPIFIGFAKVLIGCTVAAVIAEVMDMISNKNKSGLVKARYVATFVAVGAALGFALGITPSMEELMPVLKTSTEAHEKFMKLHEVSRAVFGASIVAALTALLLPLFEAPKVAAGDSSQKKVTVPLK